MQLYLKGWLAPSLLVVGLVAQQDGSAWYAQGRRALDRGDWQGAVEAFEQLAEDDAQADAALYWQAYAFNKLGDRDRALELVSSLENRFPQSEWRDEARSLAVEVRGATADVDRADEELKLMALNALMQSGDDEAVAILEEFLRGDHSERLKERALFVLAQSGSERAFEILAQTARDDAEPELQRKAIRYLGVHHSDRSLALLVEMYDAVDNLEARRAILQSFMIAGEKDRLLHVAREESNQELRGRAVRLLGTMNARDELWALYEREPSQDVRKRILRAFMVADDKERLLAVARNAQEAEELRSTAVRLLGTQDADDELWSLYRQETSQEVKKESTARAFHLGKPTERLTEVARDTEEPAELRKHAIQNLGVVGEDARPALVALYREELAMELKETILHSLFVQGGGRGAHRDRESRDQSRAQEKMRSLALRGGRAGGQRVHDGDSETMTLVLLLLLQPTLVSGTLELSASGHRSRGADPPGAERSPSGPATPCREWKTASTGATGRRARERSKRDASERESGRSELFVFYRIEGGTIGEVRTSSAHCRIDASGRTVYWWTDVSGEASLELLSRLAREDAASGLGKGGAARARAPSKSPRGRPSRVVREARAARARRKSRVLAGSRARLRWLRSTFVASRGGVGTRLREKIAFALHVSDSPGATEKLIELARGDRSPSVRAKALFWLAREAGAEAGRTIARAVIDDPELEVKKKAVFALSRLPAEEGVPLLVEVAQSHPSPEIRKKAFFWLGQSGDPRALALFERVLLER